VPSHDYGVLGVWWMAGHGSPLGIGDIWARYNQGRRQQREHCASSGARHMHSLSSHCELREPLQHAIKQDTSLDRRHGVARRPVISEIARIANCRIVGRLSDRDVCRIVVNHAADQRSPSAVGLQIWYSTDDGVSPSRSNGQAPAPVAVI
jgi:hypothetical protein